MSMNPNPFAGVQNRKTTQPIRRPGRAGHTPLALASALACVVGFTALAPSAHAQTPPSSAADSVQQVYVAFYGRPGDPDGLNYWASRVGAGGVGSILDQFSGSPEASQLFAGMSDEGKITFIYRVLFNRDSDGPGLSYWAGELSSGKRTLQEISFEILKGARNEDMAKIANKVAAANYFSSQIAARNIKADYTVQADIFLARNWLATIDETDASLVNAKANIDALLNRISLAGKPQTVTGVLATPAGSAQTAASAIKYMPLDDQEDLRGQAAKAMAALPAAGSLCFGVPDGYSPLSNASITQTDAFNQPVPGTAQADNCGMFVMSTAATVARLNITAPGYRPLSVPVNVFMDPDKNNLPDPLTLIPTSSSYRLTGLRLNSTTNQLYFNVADSATGKAVLGVSGAQVSVTNNNMPAAVSAVGYGSFISKAPASVALVLDASGSMGRVALQVAAASARLFVNRKGSTDEISMTVFDNKVTFMDQANTDAMVAKNRLVFTDGSSNPLRLAAPPNGYTTNPQFAEQILKLYDRYSDAWSRPSTDPFLRISGSYPFGGSTALYAASVAATDSLAQATNRRYALVMTDGYDNASGANTVDTAINKAKANNVATYTVAAGSSVDEKALRRMAVETGGTYTQVKDMTQVAKLSSVFDAIRTSIAFDYAAVLASPPVPGSITLQVDMGGDVIESTIFTQP